MIREVIKPVNNSYTINLPDEMLGKTIEVIAFEIDPQSHSLTIVKEQTKEEIKNKYAQYPVISHQNFKFDRDDANDYE